MLTTIHLIETSRLLLRRPTAEDAPAIFAGYASQPAVLQYLPFEQHRELGDSQQFVADLLTAQANGSKDSFAITRRSDQQLIGMIGLRGQHQATGRTELGYALDQRCWGQGYMPEAVQAMVRYAFRQGLYRVEALTLTDNRASQRVLQKSGFTREGTLRQYQYVPKLNRRIDLVMWAILKEAEASG
jgi:ribosomal-protein-alanine N-acetyltransferase